MNFLMPVLTNWKTSAPGAIALAYGLAAMFGVDVPGMPHMDPGAAWVAVLAGVTGVFAKDAHGAG